MIIAEHIIGLTALEHVAEHGSGRRQQAIQSVQQRFHDIRRAGYLAPRGRQQVGVDTGSTFDFDLLAGDGQYVFLSIGPRYRNLRDPDFCYGFAFDAQQLVDAGALVGPDLLDEYEALADEIATEIDAKLPPLPMITDEEVAQFAGLFGEHDPAMLDFIQQQSTSRYWDIIEGMKDQATDVPGVREALVLFRQRVTSLQDKMRQSGVIPAGDNLEILVHGHLSLDLAVGTIEAGKLVSKSHVI